MHKCDHCEEVRETYTIENKRICGLCLVDRERGSPITIEMYHLVETKKVSTEYKDAVAEAGRKFNEGLSAVLDRTADIIEKAKSDDPRS